MHRIDQIELISDGNILEFKSTNSFKNYFSKVKIGIFILICLFTLGSRLEISGIWCELPFMIHELPERWRLPSILSAVSQFAQIGLFINLLIRYYFRPKIDRVKVIYVVLISGTFSCFLLTFFWNKSVDLFKEKRSLYMYIFHFLFSIFDGISAITFLPYVGEYFAKEYIVPHYLGELFSSLAPAFLASIQGFQDEECYHTNQNKTYLIATYKTSSKAKFSVFIYFLLIFFLLLLSIASFSFLNFSNYARRSRKNRFSWVAVEFALSEDTGDDTVQRDKEKKQERDVKDNELEIRFMFILTVIITFVYNGFLPGLISYSTIPYSNKFFHLSINLKYIFLPFSIIFSLFSSAVSIQRICLESILPFILAFYIYIVSVFSPCPPLVKNKYEIGGYLIVFCWIISSLMFTRIRCLIATKLEKYGKSILFKLSCFTFLGQVIGGLTIFLMVDYLRLFVQGPKCPNKSFCY